MKRSFLLIVFTACASQPPVRIAPEGFGRFVDDYFAAEHAFSPSAATEYGLHEYDDKLEDRSQARLAARVAELTAFRARLRALDRSKLAESDAIDAEALAHRIDDELLGFEKVRDWRKNPMRYAGLPGSSLDTIMKRAYAPGPQRLRSVVSRLRQVPAFLAAARANLTEPPPREFTDLAIRMGKGTLGFLETSLPVWAKDAAGGDPALLAELEPARAAAVAAMRDFDGWLEKDLAPRSTGSYAIGAETFMALLREEEMVETPLPELLAIGEAQLARDHEAFVATAARIDGKKTPAEVMESLAADHPTAEDLIPAVARSLEEVRKFIIDAGIITIPSEVRPIVTETPAYARDGGFASMSTPGAFETVATEAYYYVTPVEKEWDAKHKEEHLRLFNRPVTALIDIHEAFPGHYVQFLFSQRFPTKTRKLIGAATNIEGWAHYTEQMMVDQGYGGGDPRIRLAQLSEALLRDCRFVTGIKLHTAGWTVAQGQALFEKQCFTQPAVAFEEARRGAYDPTYLYYTLGKLEIQKLAADYRKATGATLRQFHDAFVSVGPLPLPLVRRILMRNQ